MISVYALGGFEEIGKNMTAIEIDEEIIILDMGLHVDKIVSYGEREEVSKLSLKELKEIDAIPDDSILDKKREKVKAIIISHAHLDHIASVPYLESKYNCPIYLTPYSKEVLKFLAKNEGIKIKNKIKVVPPNHCLKISNNIEVLFLSITHSIPQSVIPVIRTKYGNIVYACDFKFDNHPILGKRPDYKKIKEIGKEGVKLLIVESTRVDEESKTPSEVVAKYMLEDVMQGLEHAKGLIVTTFSSHIARLKSIVEISERIGREPIFLGRSLKNYIKAAEKIGLIDFSSKYKIASKHEEISRILKEISNNKSEYTLIVTGHQGEPNSVLDRMSKGVFSWNWEKEDTVIFSSNIIPYPTNIANSQMLDQRLRRYNVRIIRDIHVSGHARKEDHRELIRMLNPEYILPMHGDFKKRSMYIELAIEEGYRFGESIFLLQNGQKMDIKN